MNLKIQTNKEQWDMWTREQGVSFLQSWEWGDILIAEGKAVERLVLVEGGLVVAQAQVVYGALPLSWQYAFCPKGPVVQNEVENMQYAAYEVLARYLKEKKCIFFRLEPQHQILNTTYQIPKSIDINPRATTILNLSKSEVDLLAGMHEKTRYNIRLAEKKGVIVKEEKNFDIFWKLMQETAERDGFSLHNKKHYAVIFGSSLSRQLVAWLGETPIAAALLVGYGDTSTYLFGASSYAARAFMAPQLLQWEAIKLSQRLGYQKYDFFGIAPKKQDSVNGYEYDKEHQYAGVTRFKLGFGGATIEDPGTHDLLISPLQYRIYEVLRRLRRLF